MYIGDGAKLIRNAFELAKEKSPAIIFIDELDAIGTKRFDSDKSGDREVQRTMLELLNQLDGFGSDDRIKVRPAVPASRAFLHSPAHTLLCRSLLQPTALIFLTLPCYAPVDWTAKSSSRCPTRPAEPRC